MLWAAAGQLCRERSGFVRQGVRSIRIRARRESSNTDFRLKLDRLRRTCVTFLSSVLEQRLRRVSECRSLLAQIGSTPVGIARMPMLAETGPTALDIVSSGPNIVATSIDTCEFGPNSDECGPIWGGGGDLRAGRLRPPFNFGPSSAHVAKLGLASANCQVTSTKSWVISFEMQSGSAILGLLSTLSLNLEPWSRNPQPCTLNRKHPKP